MSHSQPTQVAPAQGSAGAIYDDGGVSVSATIVRIGSETFSVPNLTSVRVAAPSLPLRAGALSGGGFLLVQALMKEAYGAAAIGAVLVGWALLAKSKLFVATAGGERRALSDRLKRCQAVAAAIIKAMEQRGRG